METDHEKPEPFAQKSILTFLLACLVLFVVLRARWIGHLLIWDEAITLCSIRSFLSLGTDDFSNWFWRHPPVFSMLMMLTAPFKAGFAERVEIMAIAIGLLNCLLLFHLNRKLLGHSTALWSVFFLAIQPGSVFFDVWIKTDHTATTFGLLSLLMLVNGKTLYCGIFAGLALLSKETGIFYMAGIFLLWITGAAGKRKAKDFIALTVIPILTCGWWYFGVKVFSDSLTPSVVAFHFSHPWYLKLTGGFAEHIKLATSSGTGWNNPWNYYLLKLPLIIGFSGMALSFFGILVSLSKPVYKAINTLQSRRLAMWPLFLLVPNYIFLSILSSKVPWVIIPLLPAWATLQGLAVSAAISAFTQSGYSIKIKHARLLAITAGAVIVISSIIFIYRQDYEDMLKSIDKGQWRGAYHSRLAARRINQITKKGDRVLLTSFHYWKGIIPGHACPVFAYYLSPEIEVLLRSHETAYEELIDDIVKHRIDYALLSPEPGPIEKSIMDGFAGKLHLVPEIMEKSIIFRTSTIYLSQPQPADNATGR